MDTPQFSITTEKLDSRYGKFIIEPLPQGYGHTLGVALRRVLYSSIPGSAITGVQISGASHQFTTLSGVQEDIVQLILNLKQVAISYSGDKPEIIKLSVKGPGVVKASDFELPATMTIANPDLVLAHLSDRTTKLELEATVETGFSYSPAEDRKSSTIGLIPTDAMFSPVVRVNYAVEATRVGRLTNYDKLSLEITTNGVIGPKEALDSAAQTLVGYFSTVLNPQIIAPPSSGSTSQGASSPTAGGNISIEELDLPTRIANALQKAGFDTVASLLSIPRAELAKVKNLGTKSVKIVELALKDRGFDMSL